MEHSLAYAPMGRSEKKNGKRGAFLLTATCANAVYYLQSSALSGVQALKER